MRAGALALASCLLGPAAAARPADPFRPLDDLLPTPGEARLASGHPGPSYWQQRADYELDIELDEAARQVRGRARITYHNLSPHTLPYLWVQLDNNIFARDSDAALSAVAPDLSRFSFDALRARLAMETFDGRLELDAVTAEDGSPLAHRVVGTLMRVDPPQLLAPGEAAVIVIRWHYTVNDATVIRARTGYEHFEEDGNDIFEIAHGYPRMAAYTDVRGWHNDQFLGRGEFTLEFGDFLLRLTVPADHVVAATGVLQNPEEVLTRKQRSRLEEAKTSSSPVFVVTPSEAKAQEATRAEGSKTWVFRAENVRDVAWASSRKFIWDAQGVRAPGEDRTILAMSYYPNEAEPLWSRYSTRAIVHTLDVYGRHTFPYPYPVALSVNGPVGGMEYPMISFNRPRPKEDGTYYGTFTEEGHAWEHSKYGLISVIIHEVGHNWFPMIVNSDERRWTWMDEGLNTFLQFLAEQAWSEGYPSRRGFAEDITAYMQSRRQVPIMTTSDSLLQFGNNAYAKPATALNILRETILGREIFDDAFRRYARAWRFRRPMPADFFRLMEDASGRDLDWFWRGWFYTTDHVDIALGGICRYELDSKDLEREAKRRKKARDEAPENITEIRNEGMPRLVQRIEGLKDFYDDYDPLDVTPQDEEEVKDELASLEPHERELLETDRFFYGVDFVNRGGLVMPIILRIGYAGGDEDVVRIPAHIWRRSPKQVTKLFITKREIEKIEIDPFLETADVDRSNNTWPREPEKSRFELFQEKEVDTPMKKARDAQEEKQ